jgi:PAS domain S-box-containing protein
MNRIAEPPVGRAPQAEPRPTSRSADAESLFRAVADNAPVLLWMMDAKGSCTFLNRRWLDFTGRTMPEELGWGWLEGVHPDDRDASRSRALEAIRARQPFTMEFRLCRADGQYRWMLGAGSPRFAVDGSLLGYVGSTVDLTERRERAVSVTDAERRFRGLIENAHDLVYRHRIYPTRVIEYIGGAVKEITGHSADEFYADADLAAKAVHVDDVHHVHEALNDPARLQAVVTLRWIHPDGKVVFAEHRRVAVYDASGTLVAIDGIARDVTERVDAQRRLGESQEQMRRLAARIQSAREEERATLARELHDELGQTLTAIKLDLGRATSAMRDARVKTVVIDRLQSLVGLVEIGIETVKRITTSLRPPALDHLGLPEAIRWEALTFHARTGIRCHVRADKESTGLDAEQQTAMFRIFQEALTNVVRHARASAVSVTLAEGRGVFDLRIRDNGCGITDSQVADPRAVGLLGMRERAALVGGTFHIAARRGKGTAITVRVPIAAKRSRHPPSRGRRTHARLRQDR